MAKKFKMSDGSELHFSELSGKLDGFYSLSTSVWENKICKIRQAIPGSICGDCYAESSAWKWILKDKLKSNSDILMKEVYEINDFPLLPFKVLRLESHGDLNNVIQARNYIRLAKRNHDCVIALWTKNHGFLNEAIKLDGKPDNMILGISSMYTNVVENPKYDWVDFVFTVYNADHVLNNNIEINCPRKCKTCMRCYTLSNFKNLDSPLYISEILKSDSNRVDVE